MWKLVLGTPCRNQCVAVTTRTWSPVCEPPCAPVSRSQCRVCTCYWLAVSLHANCTIEWLTECNNFTALLSTVRCMRRELPAHSQEKTARRLVATNCVSTPEYSYCTRPGPRGWCPECSYCTRPGPSGWCPEYSYCTRPGPSGWWRSCRVPAFYFTHRQ
jgi:hypothetical protein